MMKRGDEPRSLMAGCGMIDDGYAASMLERRAMMPHAVWRFIAGMITA